MYPSRRAELDTCVAIISNLAMTYGGTLFYVYHKSMNPHNTQRQIVVDRFLILISLILLFVLFVLTRFLRSQTQATQKEPPIGGSLVWVSARPLHYSVSLHRSSNNHSICSSHVKAQGYWPMVIICL